MVVDLLKLVGHREDQHDREAFQIVHFLLTFFPKILGITTTLAVGFGYCSMRNQ